MLVLLGVTGLLLIGMVLTLRLLRRASRRAVIADSARQDLIVKRQAQDMALAVAERARGILQERLDRIPQLEQAVASAEEALKLAEAEVRALREERGPSLADLERVVREIQNRQVELHTETAHLVEVFAEHFTAIGHALRERDSTAR